VLEHASKAAMFACKDCGDCSLPDIAFLCPESQCAKNQRNGPCGGTRDGKCEVYDFECIWGRAYERLKYEGREQEMLVHAPVIQDQALRGTSSWANALLGRDHTSHKPDAYEKPIVGATLASPSVPKATTKPGDASAAPTRGVDVPNPDTTDHTIVVEKSATV
jgi:methylenetetrahydrofolate reductase (NADPH)